MKVRPEVQRGMPLLWQKLGMLMPNEPMWCCERCRYAASDQTFRSDHARWAGGDDRVQVAGESTFESPLAG